MVAYEALEVEGQQLPALYTGLSATRPDQKSTGKAGKLYNYCVLDARQWEEHHRARLTVWGTTATPIVFFAAHKVFADVQPTLAGAYSEESACLARAVARRMGVSRPAGTHPFVFPQLAAGVRYSEEERHRLAAVRRTSQFDLFDRLGVDEARGDRLLFVGGIPAAPAQPAD